MYATINLPGSQHFRWFGPAPKAECYAWLVRTLEADMQKEQLSATLPRQVITNREAQTWRYEDGSHVFTSGKRCHWDWASLSLITEEN